MPKSEIPQIEQEMIRSLKRGQAIVFQIPGRGRKGHTHVHEWAQAHGKFVRIDRKPWRGPFVTGKGNLDAVFRYALWAGLHHEELSKHLPRIKGMALGCTCQCAPDWCHGSTLLQILNERKPLMPP